MPQGNLGRIGIALGSGSARGWAHIGVLQVLVEAGLAPTIVCGTSIGAVVGAAYAAGKLDVLDHWVRGLDAQKVRGLLDFSGRGGLFRAARVIKEVTAQLGHPSVESLTHEFCAVASDLYTGREVWLREGPLEECLRASAALPGLVTPVRIKDRWLVDGGLVNPVPIAPCRALGADTVIAVDLNTTLLERRVPKRAAAVEAEPEPEEAEDQGGRISWGEWVPASLSNITAELRERFFSTPGEEPPPAIYEVMAQSINIMQVRITRSRMSGDPPDVLVAPRLRELSLLDFHRAADAIAEGRRAATRALTAVPMS